MEVVKTYGKPGTRGIPAHQFIIHRVNARPLPAATTVLIEKEWMRIKKGFSHEMTVPFYEGLTPDGVRVSARPFRFAAVFNHNPMRPKNIEPLYASHAFAQFGELLLILTADGSIVYAKKINQQSQYSGFGGHIDMEHHHQQTIALHEAMPAILEKELGPLAAVANMRVVGIECMDQTFKRGVDVCLIAESKHSDEEWRTLFPVTDQFSRELLFVEPTADALVALVTAVTEKGGTFSPSCITTTYLALRALRNQQEANQFADTMRAIGYPLTTRSA